MSDNGTEPDDLTITFKLAGGETYTVRHVDMTAIDARDFRRAVGERLVTVFAGTLGADLDVIAGLLWLTRRRDEPHLTYEQVAEDLRYADLEAVDQTTEAAEVDPTSSPG